MTNVERQYRQRTPASLALFAKTQRVIPGGMSQGTRYYKPYPIYVSQGQGSRIWDVDGNEYVDYFLAATALLLGHAHPRVVQAVTEQLPSGSNFGLPYEWEARVAAKLIDMVPSAEAVKFTNSGMDATMLAVRVARAYTGRADVVAFDQHFYGWEDQLYRKARGIPAAVQQHTIRVPYNCIDSVEQVIHEKRPAAVILEPFSTNAGAVPPDLAFLQRLRQLTADNNVILVFDEVVTNFRLARGGAQEFFGVIPDLTAVGKPLSGGFTTIGALVGRADVMEVTSQLATDYVYHGTWMTPPTMVAALTTLELLEDGHLIAHANRLGDRMRDGLNQLFMEQGVAAQAIGIGSAVRVHFTANPIRSADDLRDADKAKLWRFHLGLVNRGHFVLPGKNAYTSVVHTDAEIDSFLDAAKEALQDAHGSN